MKKLACIFPGIGYTTEKPLLYYATDLAAGYNYDIYKIEYHDFPKDAKTSHKSMLEAIKIAATQTEQQLKNINFAQYEDILFISKSLGTVAAALYADKHNLPARHIYFTPLAQTFAFAQNEKGLVFTGTADPWVKTEDILKACEQKALPIHTIADANHSLETKDTLKDIANLTKIMTEVNEYIHDSSIYQFTVKTYDGKFIKLSEYRGKILLIVNSATGCGFTPQYKILEQLYEKYHDEGFEILDFPCNQFEKQAPGSSASIHSFCTMQYNISFQQFQKIKVNGPQESELYTYLKQKQGFSGYDLTTKDGKFLDKVASINDPDYRNNDDIKWNFTKFLVDRQGMVVRRFETADSFETIDSMIQTLLSK